jgi:hypothetical protein
MPGTDPGLYKHVGGYGRGTTLHQVFHCNQNLKCLISMALDSSSSGAAPAVPLQPISKKLTWANFPVLKALVMSALRGAQMHQFLDGKVEFPPKELTLEDKKMKIPNLDYVMMAAKEHQVLNYLLSSLSHDILL